MNSKTLKTSLGIRAALMGALLFACVLLLPAAATAATANLGLTKADSPDPVTEGAVLTYTSTITNNGPQAVEEALVTEKLPSQIDFISAESSQGNCDRRGKNVECELGALANEAMATVTLKVRPAKPGTITSTGTVEVGNADTDPVAANDSDSESTTVKAAPEPPVNLCGGREVTITGTDGADVITGTKKADVIKTGSGDDKIRGIGKNDFVCSGGGNDVLRGGNGNDFLKGGPGADLLKGGSGNDVLKGGRGDDKCRGGAGTDVKKGC